MQKILNKIFIIVLIFCNSCSKGDPIVNISSSNRKGYLDNEETKTFITLIEKLVNRNDLKVKNSGLAKPVWQLSFQKAGLKHIVSVYNFNLISLESNEKFDLYKLDENLRKEIELLFVKLDPKSTKIVRMYHQKSSSEEE